MGGVPKHLAPTADPSSERASTAHLGDGIVSAGVEWMAPGDAPKREPTASEDAVLLDGFDRVFRAGRMEPAARPKKRRDQASVDANRQDEHPPEHASIVRGGATRGGSKSLARSIKPHSSGYPLSPLPCARHRLPLDIWQSPGYTANWQSTYETAN